MAKTEQTDTQPVDRRTAALEYVAALDGDALRDFLIEALTGTDPAEGDPEKLADRIPRGGFRSL
ncbi:hypothetical protein [Tomitella gaofuii]|uniref:hypothetical protein n=1 Tax=Tomitella gaofuii TaxID=2760083 RepID=UPI0015F91E6E|nr:hypothetical protein [Tomitella gaofuii]